jgi:hypothetical protein
MVAALARPVKRGGLVPVVTSSRDTLILIDRSGSMGMPYHDNDGATKYGLAREIAARFIEARPDDRLTACVFFDYSYDPGVGSMSIPVFQIVCPLPLDRDRRDHDFLIRWLRTPDEAMGGTPLDRAMIAALKHLDEMGQTGERTLIVVSDGEGTWSPEMELEISQLLKKTHTKLFWVYVEEAFRIRQKVRGEVVWYDSQQGLLRLIDQTGGRRFDAGSPGELDRAFDVIKALAKEPAIVMMPVDRIELYPIVLSASLALILAAFSAMRLFIR